MIGNTSFNFLIVCSYNDKAVLDLWMECQCLTKFLFLMNLRKSKMCLGKSCSMIYRQISSYLHRKLCNKKWNLHNLWMAFSRCFLETFQINRSNNHKDMLRKDGWNYLNALLQLDLSLIECLMTIHSIAYFYAKFVYV